MNKIPLPFNGNFMTLDWPNKNLRESFEINGFIESYRKLPHGREFEIVKKGENPDYTLKDLSVNEFFGVELTSVYIDNRSVPDIHMKAIDGPTPIPNKSKELEQYKQQLLKAISNKINKAKSGYDTSFPLILSVYVNEYISIYLRKEDLETLVSNNE